MLVFNACSNLPMHTAHYSVIVLFSLPKNSTKKNVASMSVQIPLTVILAL